MKFYTFILTFVFLPFVQAQSSKFDFLVGTWKIDGKESFEHWDQLSANTLKGLTYNKTKGAITVTEYLDLRYEGNHWVYSATVKGQNQGEPTDFRLIQDDTVFVFENMKHDFPQQIIYQKRESEEINITLSASGHKSVSYLMRREGRLPQPIGSGNSNPHYDASLAQRLEGDDYGMKQFVLVMLKTGSNKSKDKDLINKSFRGHLDNINLLVSQGKMTVAGPLEDKSGIYRGIFILNVTTLEEAKALLEGDTAISAGFLDYDLYPWYGSAALPEYLDAADKIWRKKP